MPVGLLLLLGLGLAGGAYALSQRGSDDNTAAPAKKKTARKPPPLSEQLPGAKDPRTEEIKRKICTVKAKAEQGDKDAGRVLDDLKRLYGNITK